jgi:hypothetical protein
MYTVAVVAGLYRDAEKQFKSALKDQDMIMTNLELIKVSTSTHSSCFFFIESHRCAGQVQPYILQYSIARIAVPV